VLKDAVAALLASTPLEPEAATSALGEIMDGSASPALAAAFLTALRMKGETAGEIAGAARALRARALKVDAGPGAVLDTCGTGGDGAGTFNVSTLAALVAGAAGARVAKHGNRAASSKCGSSDLLEALGCRIELDPGRAGRLLRELGFTYLHAPSFHPAMKHAAPVRKELGFRTIFNVLGPLSNPAGADAQVIGVYQPPLARTIAEVLRTLGSRRAFVFHGADGLDELSTTGENLAVELVEGRLEERRLTPESAGLPRARVGDLLGGGPADNAAIAREILGGARGPRRDIVVLNAAYGLLAAGTAADPLDGARRAAEALDSGAARRLLDAFAEASRRA
jgi:anthranilate phosphoribosyltransferase